MEGQTWPMDNICRRHNSTTEYPSSLRYQFCQVHHELSSCGHPHNLQEDRKCPLPPVCYQRQQFVSFAQKWNPYLVANRRQRTRSVPFHVGGIVSILQRVAAFTVVVSSETGWQYRQNIVSYPRVKRHVEIYDTL